MFKMGCSMAKKILAIDKQSSNHDHEASGSGLDLGSSSSSSKKSKGKHQQQDLHFSTGASAANAPNQVGANKIKTNTEELGDFSKLEQDPRIPLNIRQIFKITKSWKAIARTMSKTGTAMFLNLFEQNQDLFYLFERFQHLKGKELHESMELREHASTVMSTLDQSINSLSDYDNFVTYLHSIGKLHRKVPGFKRAHFWKIEQPFLKAVKQTLDERCNETIEEIYKIAIKLIIETIADGYGEDDLTAPTNENKDSTSPSGSNNNSSSNNNNNNNDGNAENSRDLSGSGVSGNTKAGGNSGSTNTTTNSGNKKQQTIPFGSGQNKVLVAMSRGGENNKEELKSNGSFVNSLRSYKRKLFNRNRKRNKPTNKRRKSENSSSIRNEMNGNVRLMNLEEDEGNEIENQIHLKQSGGKQVVAAINKQKKQQHVERGEKKEMKQNEFEMRSNCSTPPTSSNSSFNGLVEKAYTTRRESQQDDAFSRLNHSNNDTQNNRRLHEQANDERLNETLLVLKELLLSLTAKKECDKNSKELEESELQQQLKKATLVDGGEIEPPLTNECENSFNKGNNSNLVELRDKDTTTNGARKQVELLNEIADSFEREEKNELSSEAQTKCLVEEDYVKEKDNKGKNSCKYRENFAKNNNSKGCYCNTTSIDHTLKVCEASCRFNHSDDDDDEEEEEDDEQEKKQDIRGVRKSIEKKVTCLKQIDQQQTIPSSAQSNTELDKVQVVKGEAFEDKDDLGGDGDESDSLNKRLNVEKSVDDSLDKGLVILVSNCPLRIHRECECEATTEFDSEKETARVSLEKRKNKIACEVKTKQVSVRDTLKEKNDSENVNCIEVAKEEEMDGASRALVSLFPTSSEAAALHSKAGFNLALPQCHSKNIKCYVNGNDDDDDENDATNNHHHDAPPKLTETTTTKFYDSSIWCSKLSIARKNVVRTLKINAAKVTRSKQTPCNSLDNELPHSKNTAANSRLPISRSNLSSKSVTKTGKTTRTRATNSESDVDENLTHPRWQTGKLVCSLAKRITKTKRPTLYNEQMLPSQQQRQQKLPLVNDQLRVEKEEEEVKESDAFGLVEETKYKQSSEKQPKLKFHLFGDKTTTESFLIPSFWSSSSFFSSLMRPFFGIRNRKRRQMRKQTSNNNYHHQSQRPDVTLETLERSPPEDSGEQSSKSKEQIKLTTTTTTTTTTEAFKLGKSSLLTTDLSDLSELIKMLMLTITSKKHHHHYHLKQTGINNYIDNNDVIN